ncbi:amino acid adenylation domain-containing protein [Rhodobacterales bacterium HKCCE2091]|nr:amino acid adenylation domain-containing protein [Rhodobacterales bacterium HKCCE2091]
MTSSISSRLIRAAEAAPGAEVVRHGGAVLTFADLVARAGQTAGWLAAQGVRRGDRVAILMRRTLMQPVAVHGVLAAGAAYVPIDPAAPPARIRAILDDCEIEVMISEDAHSPRIAEAAACTRLRAILGLSGDIAGIDRAGWSDSDGIDPVHVHTGPDDLAYVMFTSGSTGTPKGMAHTHASALAFADMAAALCDLGPGDRLAAVSGLHFDMSCMELFAGLLHGATAVMVPEPVTMMPASLSALLQTERVSVIYTVPFLLVRLLEAGGIDGRDLSALRLIVSAGEAVPPGVFSDLRRHLPDARLANFYGPAEVNVVTVWVAPEGPLAFDGPVPIGSACPHTELLTDPATGELLAATPAMMRGYWRRPDLDAAAFVRRRGADGGMRRWYRTGDIVRDEGDGDLRLVGRADRQVKIRGYRVELDEVERVLAAHPAVSEAAVLVAPDGLSLRAWTTAAPGAAADPAELVRAAAAILPPYAVPSEICVVPAMPRTGSGKIDRRRLMPGGAGTDEEDIHARPC